MSDLEFQRELSPAQIREALSLLDGAAAAQNRNLRIEDSRPAEAVNREPDHSSTTMAPQGRPPAAEDPQQRKKHLNLAVAFSGIAIAAAGALALFSWSESVLPPPMPGIAHEQLPEQSAAPPLKSASSALPVAKPPPDESPGGSERQPWTPQLAGLSGAVRDAANSDSASPPVARWATNERVSRRPEHTPHARVVRVAAAKKRFWRLHWQARAEDEWCIVACRRADGQWCFFGCRTWRAQPVFYERPRNVTQ